MSLGKIDKAIATIEFILKKRRDLVERESRKIEISENKRIYIGQETELINCIEILIKRYKDDINKNLGRLPPQALELEQAVIGALLTEGGVKKYKGEEYGNGDGLIALKFLESKHFYDQRHQSIFNACVAINSRKETIDVRSAAAELRRMAELETVGAAYLTEVSSVVVNSHNVKQHGRVMIEMAIKREFITMAGQLMSEGYDSTKDCFEMLEYAENTLKSIKSWIK